MYNAEEVVKYIYLVVTTWSSLEFSQIKKVLNSSFLANYIKKIVKDKCLSLI